MEPSEDWDTPLTAKGREQARLLGTWLAGHDALDDSGRLEVEALRSSPSVRARQTIADAAELLELEVGVVPDLAEASFHVADHLPAARRPFAAPEPWEISLEYAAFKSQAERALRALTKEAEVAGGTIVASTHGGLIKTLLRLVVGSDSATFRLYNTGLNVISWRAGRWELLHLNLCDHLPPELRTL